MSNLDYYSLRELYAHGSGAVKYIRSRWKFLLLCTIAGAGIGVLYTKIQKPKYIASCSFILEEKQSALGGLSSLASQFGLDMGSLTSGGNIFAGDNILNILTSRKIVEDVLLSYADTTGGSKKRLADLYLHFSGLEKKWSNKEALRGVSFQNAGAALNRQQDSALAIIYDRVVRQNLVAERVNKKGSIIKVQVNSSDNRFSSLMTTRLVEEASKLYFNIKTANTQEVVIRMQMRSDSLMRLLNTKSFQVAQGQPLDINPGLKSVLVPTEIATRDKSLVATLYAEVVKNLETSKLMLSQQTPVIQVLDAPGITLEDHKVSLFKATVVASILALGLGANLLFVRYFLRQMMKD